MSTSTARLGATILATAALVALALLVAAPGQAGARRPERSVSGTAPPTAETLASESTTIRVVEHAITDTENPGVDGADVKGNILTFNNPVFNAANTRQVAHDEGFCTRVQPQLGIWECLWTTFLHGGQITVQGPYYDTRNSTLSITGGTGDYQDDRGQMLLKSRDGGKEYDFVFELSS